MSEEAPTDALPATGAETAAPAPELPSATPASPSQPAAVDAPPSPSSEPAAAGASDPAPADHKPSLLSEAMKPTESAPGEKALETPPSESKDPAAPDEKTDAPAEPAPAPIEYEFKLPENVKLSDTESKEIKDLFNEGRAAPEFGQKLLDRHYQEVTKVAERMVQQQWQDWNKLQDNWKEQSRSDPEIGGNRFETTLSNAASVLDEFGTPALRQALDTTGIGNHPEFIRMLASIEKRVNERRASPTAARPPAPPKSKADILYSHE